MDDGWESGGVEENSLRWDEDPYPYGSEGDYASYDDEDDDQQDQGKGKGKEKVPALKDKSKGTKGKAKGKPKKKKKKAHSLHQDASDDEFWQVESDNEPEQEQFTILTREQLMEKQMAVVEAIAGELGLSKWDAGLILQYFDWSADKLHAKYWDNPGRVCSDAGIRISFNEDSPTDNPQKSDVPSTENTPKPKKKKKRRSKEHHDSAETIGTPKKKKKKKKKDVEHAPENATPSDKRALETAQTETVKPTPKEDNASLRASSGNSNENIRGSKEGATAKAKENDKKKLGTKLKLKKRGSSKPDVTPSRPEEERPSSEASPAVEPKKKESKLPLKLKIKSKKTRKDAAERKSEKAAAKEEKKRNAAAKKEAASSGKLSRRGTKRVTKDTASAKSGNDALLIGNSVSMTATPAPAFRKPEITVVYEEHPAWMDLPSTECLICFDDISQGEAVHLSCNHGPYCAFCWQNHLAVTVQTTGSVGILNATCMWPGCPTKINYGDFQKLAAQEHFQRYLYFFTKHYVDCNKYFSFCPNPSCTNVILFNGCGKPALLVKCTCSYQFCFACGLENHNPVTCEQLDKWNQRNMDDQESLKLIMATTKRCFHCNIPTTRTDGCNHMTCRKEQGGCGGQWCWMCRGDWKTHGPHTGGFYSCNKYEASEGKKLDDEAAKLKEDSDRYLHYFERYFAHATASRNIQQQLEKAKDKMNDYSNSVDATNADFFVDAVKLLSKCRHILKYTHVYGFYLADGSKGKDFFEHLQANAEGITEVLARMVNAPLNELNITDFKNRIRVTNEYINNLVKALEDGLGVEGLGTK